MLGYHIACGRVLEMEDSWVSREVIVCSTCDWFKLGASMRFACEALARTISANQIQQLHV